jgi:hypothetical protein
MSVDRLALSIKPSQLNHPKTLSPRHAGLRHHGWRTLLSK